MLLLFNQAENYQVDGQRDYCAIIIVVLQCLFHVFNVFGLEKLVTKLVYQVSMRLKAVVSLHFAVVWLSIHMH